jgi:lipopolysaccharide/colanic/teichoic acid biosynthesis glycosyltransferase
MPLAGNCKEGPRRYILPLSKRFLFAVKRAMDIVLSILLLIVLSPFFFYIILLIRFSSQGSAFFIQERIGKDGSVFPMCKFRTMFDGAHEQEGQMAHEDHDRIFFKIKDDPRVTTLGVFLRKYSIDELPQLFNVLRNDMSLVGPRPLLLSDFHKFPKGWQMRRFSMKPGITGLWQVSGRSELTDGLRIALDLEYVDNWALRQDIILLIKTLPAVIRGDGAY